MHVVAERRVRHRWLRRCPCVKSRGCEVVKRTRRIPATSPTAASNSAKDFFPADPVRVHVLPEQLDVGEARVGHAPRFRQHRIRSPAALFAARERNHAVGAELVAAFDDGDVSAMRIAARGEFGFKGLVGLAVVETSDALVPCLESAPASAADCDRTPSRRPARHTARARRSSRLPAAPRSRARRTSCPCFAVSCIRSGGGRPSARLYRGWSRCCRGSGPASSTVSTWR